MADFAKKVRFMGQKTQSLGRELEDAKIVHLPLNPPLFASKDTPLRKVLEKMRKARTGCTLIAENYQVIGIFTERDVLARVIEEKADLSAPIESFMTPQPEVLSSNDILSRAVQIMYEGGYRHIPIKKTDKEGNDRVIGILSIRNLIRYFGSNFPDEVYNLPPNPQQENRAREGA